MHSRLNCLFKYVPRLFLKMSQCLANTIQQAVIHFRSSLSLVVSLHGAVSQFQINVAFSIHILVCRFPSSRHDFHFHQLAAA